ncbi:MAG TPA: pyruvate kinase [Longimicrobiales bacterium]
MPQHRPGAGDPALTSRVLDRLALEVQQLRQDLLAGEAEFEDELARVHPDNRASARNLVHYLALRRHDVRALQLRLARVGLSSLGRSESHVLVTVDRVLAMLALARGGEPAEVEPPPVGFRQGERILARNARRLLGVRRPHRAVRIMVTLPREAADEPRFAHDLIAAGMDCARINCARDDAAAWAAMADNVRAAQLVLGRECRILADLGGRKLRTGPVAGGAKRLLVAIGDRFEMLCDTEATPVRDGSLPRIACSAPALFDAARPGQPIWFDDGAIGGVIEQRTDTGLLIRVTHARPEGSKLRPDRGINVPETVLLLPAVTAKDLLDLASVVDWTDAIELSYVQEPQDVLALHDVLDRHGAHDVNVVLKIETRLGFSNLPRLLLTAMRRRTCGVMIARGDLAVEAGFERMAEMQEEILWIAEAAHVPTIWATQVMDELATHGTLSRAEITDAAMSARAEAVMLNKGPFIVDAIRALDDILARMKDHQSKKRALYRALRVSTSLWPEAQPPSSRS